MRADVFPYRLPLKRPWVAAAATLAERRGALLRLTADDGLTGWGDCAPLPSGGNADAVLAALDEYCRRPAGADFSALPPEVRWAIETARLDLDAQRQGVPLARLLAPGAPLDIAINAALGPLDAGSGARAVAALEQGHAIGKLKVGLAGIDAELARLRALVDATRGRLRLRLDANRAWPHDDAARFLAALGDLPIDGVEEPLAAPTLAGLAALQAASPFPLAADESLPALGVEALIATRAVRRLVLKPARLGGHAATRAIARQAQAAGIEVVLTSVIDSAIGVAAAAHLAAALSPQLAHGLGTGAWLAADIAPPLPVRAGRIALPDLPGLGLRPGQ
ncbi:MAG: o-succinylbenzoate synthase [Pseudomonadota bacterium]